MGGLSCLRVLGIPWNGYLSFLTDLRIWDDWVGLMYSLSGAAAIWESLVGVLTLLLKSKDYTFDDSTVVPPNYVGYILFEGWSSGSSFSLEQIMIKEFLLAPLIGETGVKGLFDIDAVSTI